MADKRWVVPNERMNQIKYRVPRKQISVMINSPLEPNFATWEEAHEYLVAFRRGQVADCRLKLANLCRQLNGATAMEAPHASP